MSHHTPSSSNVKQRWAALLTFVALIGLSVLLLQYSRFLDHAQADRDGDNDTRSDDSSPSQRATPGPTRRPNMHRRFDNETAEPSHSGTNPVQLTMGPSPQVLAIESRPFRLSRNQLPERFRQYETSRFVVLSDADVSWTRHQAERLERAHHQFHRWAKRMDLDPQPLRHKLVAVLFSDRDDYTRFARQYENVTDAWMCGFYSPANDRLVFYDIETSPDLINARSQLQRMDERINIMLHAPVRRHAQVGHDDNIQPSDGLDRYRQYQNEQEQRLEKYVEQMSASTTIHEAVHQLLFHTRIQSPYVQYPLWVSEGLATTFETDAPHRAFGPAFEYEPRREQFQEHLLNDNLIPLAAFITMVKPPSDRNGVDVLYHQSYAFMTWLSRFRDKQLVTYLNRMAERKPGPLSSQEHRAMFEQCFGDIGRLENEWLRRERAALR